VRPVQGALEGKAAQAQTTAPVANSVERMFAANTSSEITSTTMMMRRMNSLISPPNNRAAPVATRPSSEMVKATGPLMSLLRACSGVSHGKEPPADAACAGTSGREGVGGGIGTEESWRKANGPA